jgi:predicted Zn finger-like uncharacterized protein
MIVACQGCSKRFVLDGKLVKPGGSRVRCSRCGAIFRVYPEDTWAGPEAAAAASNLDEPCGPVADQRRFHRIPVAIPTVCSTTDPQGEPEDLHIGAIREISQGGAAIELPRCTVSDVLGLSFIGADDTEVQISCRVRHSRPHPPNKIRVGVSLLGEPIDISRFVMQAVRAQHQSEVPFRTARAAPVDGQAPAP